MSNALVPELAVADCQVSLAFYCGVLGFTLRYARPEEGFAYLNLGQAELMIDQIDQGRTFDADHQPPRPPYGWGVNLQIRVPDVAVLVSALYAVAVPLVLPVEDRWYRRDLTEVGNRQFIVADPDGYLLRFYQDLGTRDI